VPEDLRVLAAGVFEGVREDRYAALVKMSAGQDTILVDCFGEPRDEAITPGEQRRGQRQQQTEGVAEDVPQHTAQLPLHTRSYLGTPVRSPLGLRPTGRLGGVLRGLFGGCQGPPSRVDAFSLRLCGVRGEAGP
jgi:hypothetical protein